MENLAENPLSLSLQRERERERNRGNCFRDSQNERPHYEKVLVLVVLGLVTCKMISFSSKVIRVHEKQRKLLSVKQFTSLSLSLFLFLLHGGIFSICPFSRVIKYAYLECVLLLNLILYFGYLSPTSFGCNVTKSAKLLCS